MKSKTLPFLLAAMLCAPASADIFSRANAYRVAAVLGNVVANATRTPCIDPQSACRLGALVTNSTCTTRAASDYSSCIGNCSDNSKTGKLRKCVSDCSKIYNSDLGDCQDELEDDLRACRNG